MLDARAAAPQSPQAEEEADSLLLRKRPDRSGARGAALAPALPQSIAETGLDRGFLTDLLMKIIYRLSLDLPSRMCAAIKLPTWIVEDLLEGARNKNLVEPLGQAGAELRYSLTDKGRSWALEALEQSEWAGPAPVPLEQLRAQSEKQAIRNEVLTRPMLEEAFEGLLFPEHLMGELGPAVNSGASMLLYGPPGNGKSSISEAVCAAFKGHVYVPHAVTVDNQIITVFDPTVHDPVEMRDTAPDESIRRERGSDARWIACRRPTVITGGELLLDHLDLAYSPVSRIYEAPMQMKASGGVFVIDDFGRQRQSPQELVNRMIIPLEKGVDYLSLQTGRKFETPFDALIVFSTNIPPKELVDDAALRRLRYKVLIDKPDRDTYLKIWVHAARKAGMEITEDILRFLLMELYARQEGAEFHAFHPRFLIDQTKSICAYEGVEPQLRPEFLARAWKNLFTDA